MNTATNWIGDMFRTGNDSLNISGGNLNATGVFIGRGTKNVTYASGSIFE